MSKLILVCNATNVKVNDVIQLKIEMHDGYGRRKTVGGDLVRKTEPKSGKSIADKIKISFTRKNRLHYEWRRRCLPNMLVGCIGVLRPFDTF